MTKSEIYESYPLALFKLLKGITAIDTEFSVNEEKGGCFTCLGTEINGTIAVNMTAENLMDHPIHFILVDDKDKPGQRLWIMCHKASMIKGATL